MKMMKELRDGKKGDRAQDAMAEFVRLVEETFGHQEKEQDETNTIRKTEDIMNI
jgi:hypothetical protein